MGRFKTYSARVDVCFRSEELGNPTIVSSFLLVEILEGGLVHIFLADVENQVDLLLCSDLFD